LVVLQHNLVLIMAMVLSPLFLPLVLMLISDNDL
jgi:hypothetical protein